MDVIVEFVAYTEEDRSEFPNDVQACGFTKDIRHDNDYRRFKTFVMEILQIDFPLEYGCKSHLYDNRQHKEFEQQVESLRNAVVACAGAHNSSKTVMGMISPIINRKIITLFLIFIISQCINLWLSSVSEESAGIYEAGKTACLFLHKKQPLSPSKLNNDCHFK